MMRIKEQALIDAVDRLGPSWSPSHPVLMGPWVVFLLSIFGAVLGLFQAAGRGAATWPQLYGSMQIGVYLSFIVAIFAFFVVLIQAAQGDGERDFALPFFVSGIASMAVITLADIVFGAALRDLMASWPPLVGSR